MQRPKISVIMSVYNGEEYLAEAIDSIIAQSFTDWEFVIINDCSVDSTKSILEEYSLKDERIKVYDNEINLKLPSSLNRAISLSSGKYIARMDADDIALPNRLEKQFSFMENNTDIALSSCRFMTLKKGVYSPGGCGGRCDNEALKALLLVANPILHPGVIAKAEVMKTLNYDTSLTCTEDLELWTRMAARGLKMQILPEFLMVYRLHEKQITSTTLEKQHREVLKIQDAYYGSLLKPMSRETQEFYISGIYFREKTDLKKFLKFLRWLKAENKEKANFPKDALNYAMLEVLAEYKRHGQSKVGVIKAMLSFEFIFLVKELLRRKNDSKSDVQKIRKVAKELDLIQCAGTNQFPIFTKKQ